MSKYLGNFDQAAYQNRIDQLIGTKNGRPLIKLAWAPDEHRWYPYKMGSGEPPGYTFPIFCNSRNADGDLVAPNRWALLERVEPEQFAPGWEAGRYAVNGKEVWDIKGPCPSERYIELRCHSYHDGQCCPCNGDTCECGEQYDHCWGRYLEPNEKLLNWIQWTYKESVNDSDVQPTQDARYFEAPEAQRNLVTAYQIAYEKDAANMQAFDQDAVNMFLKQKHSINVNRFKKTESGLIVPN